MHICITFSSVNCFIVVVLLSVIFSVIYAMRYLTKILDCLCSFQDDGGFAGVFDLDSTVQFYSTTVNQLFDFYASMQFDIRGSQ